LQNRHVSKACSAGTNKKQNAPPVGAVSDMKDPVYRFAEFELDSAAGELRKGSTTIRLQDKPRRLLLVLLENPQGIVTREQLRARMWDSRTVIEFEQGINAAMKKVRDALGDAADSPRIIETVAKRGYRLRVPVDVVNTEAPAEVPAEIAPEPLLDLPPPAHNRGRWWMALAPVVLFAFGFWWHATAEPSTRPTHIHSIAVLPLRNLSPDPDQEYFVDGITEDVISKLAQTLPLRVISRTSVMRYKEARMPIAEIARELDVEAIVEGAVTRSGERVSVTVQLIDAHQDRHLWADKYERRIEDIASIEEELSHAIAAQVSDVLTRHLAHHPPARRVEPQAYEFTLLGRHHWNQHTATDFARAEQYFKRALESDASYAPAWAGLADVYALWPYYASVDMRQSFAQAEQAAKRAIELDGTLPEPHATLGLLVVGTRDWARAAEHFRRALELNPNYAPAHHWYSSWFLFAARHSEALAELRVARQLDPLSPAINADSGHMLYVMRRYEEARLLLERAMELQPGFGQPHATLALVEFESGHLREAETQARAALALDPRNPRTMGEAGYIFAVLGKRGEAERLLASLETMAAQGAAVLTFPALVKVGLGRRAEALDELERIAHSTNGVGLPGVDQWHAFDDLFADARVRELVSQAR